MSTGDSTYKLPEGWIWTTIGEIGIVTSGGTPSTKNSEFWNGDIPWVTPADLSNYRNVYIEKGLRNISDIGMEYSSAKLLPKGSILFSSRAPIGYVAIAKNELATNQGFKNIIPTPSLFSEYVFYYLKTIKPLAEKMASGTTFLELSASKFAKLPIPLPPLSEQQRIVSKIEEVFSELDHSESNLKKAQKQLEIYRHSLLKSAFEEKNYVRLSEIADVITKGASPKWQGINYTENSNDVLFITSENIRNNYIDIVKKKYVEKRFNQIQSRSILQKGDVLLNIVGASIGRAAFFDLNISANINQAVALIRPLINFKYLTFFLNSPIAIDYYGKRMVNVARANLSLKDVAEMLIPYCSEEKQNIVVQELESKFTLIEHLEYTIKTGLHKIEIFRQSVLKRTFEGKLINQDSIDEPALLLIKRIQNEKQIYLKNQDSIEQQKPKRKTTMEKSNLSVKEVLAIQSEAISAKNIWKQSKYQNDLDIDQFYAELKDLENFIEIRFNEKETLISWKNEN